MFGRMIGYVEDADKLEKAADELIPRCICHVYACMHACVYACMRVCVDAWITRRMASRLIVFIC